MMNSWPKVVAIVLTLSLMAGDSWPALCGYSYLPRSGPPSGFNEQAIVAGLSHWTQSLDPRAKINAVKMGLRQRFIRGPEDEYPASLADNFPEQHWALNYTRWHLIGRKIGHRFMRVA